MLTVTAGDVMSTLRGGDGQPLVRVGDALLRAELARSAVAQANIETDHKSHADGGVDTTVAVALAHDRLGYFGAPSCWQYKGTSQQGFGDSKVRAELKKDRCISLIKKGYAWRLVIADEIPAGKRANLLKTARDAVRQLNPTAPDPIIVTASDMSNWISQYPSLVLRFFAVPNAELLHIDAWNDSIIRDTPQYQEIPSWAAVRSAIERHCDFSANPVSSVLAIQGQAGVGKTRLVFETLHRHEGTRQLVVYTAHSGAAEKIAYYLARENETRCVLVVDECSPTLRLHLEQVLNGTRCRTRVRVVALDNSGVRASRSAVEAQQPSMNATELGLVLGANFPQVPSDRRRTYAELAEGFIRLAADLCVSDPLASTQSLQIPGGLHQYVTSRLGSRQPALEALGLVWRIGFRDDVADEFQALCSWLSLDPQLTRSQLREMKERPGFAKDAGRYVYVSPEIVARMMFEAGWNRWAHHEPEAFLEKLPDALFDAFLKRVERSAEPQVRRVVAAHFRRWLEALSSTDLRDAEKVKRARLLVEADVDANLRLLEHVVRAASIDDLREVTGTRGWGGGWGPRRHLVWLLESVVRLPQCFHAVEAMLRRLAKAESEPGIGNNATAIHQQIFGIYLSGTPLPFDTRVKVLEDSLTNDGDDDRLLTVAVLEVVLKGHHSRSGGTTFVGGTLPPPEWRPTSSEEVMNATRRIVSLLVLASNDHAINVARAAAAALAQNTRRLLYGGFLRELQAVFAAREKALSFGSNILREIDAYLRWDNPGGASPEQDEYRSTVQKWAASLVPPDIEGRLVRYIGPGASIAGDGNAAEWATALEALVSDLTTGDTLTQHLDWLSSEEARGAVYVGAGIGRIDPEGTRLAMVIDAAARSGETAFARGYCVGYASLGSTQMRRISEAIDGIDDAAPTVAFEISVQVEALDACIARALRAVDAGTLPAAVLSSHRFEYDAEPLLPHDGERMLRTLLRAVTSGDELATRGSAHLLSSWSQATHGQPHLFEDGAFREAAWALIEALCEHRGTDGYHWEQAIGHLAKFDYNRAVLVGVTGLAGESLQISTAAENILIRFAPDHGDKIVDQLGKTLLDEERGWRFRVRSLRVLTSSLPAERFIQWLSQVGVDGARHLARHLETPTLADDGRVLVSPLTEYVLTTFADDDETFEEFVSGSHAMQVYQGDIAALHEAEADAARAMLNHPVRRIREWAAREVQSAEAGAARWRRYDDELPTDF